MELGDGSIVQDGLKFNERKRYPSEAVSRITYPVKAQVLAVYEIDAVDNRDGETTVCDVYVTSLGIPLYKVPFGLQKASVDNYIHYGPVPATGNVDFSGFNPSKLTPKVSNGDTVVVIFIDADVHDPMIIGMAPHNQSGFDGISPSPRPGMDDGDMYKARFNGTNFSIDKDGNVEFESTDTVDPLTPKNKKFAIKWKSSLDVNQEVTVEFDNSMGSPRVFLEAKNNLGKAQSILLDGSAGTTTITSEDATGANIIEMGASGISITVETGALNINLNQSGDCNLNVQNGNLNITTTNGDTTIDTQGETTINSSGDMIVDCGGDLSATVGGDCDIEATGKATIKADMIDLNGGGALLESVLTSPSAISDFTGLPIQVASTTVKAST